MARFLLDVAALGAVTVEADTRDQAINKWKGLEVWEQESLRSTYVTELKAQQSRLGLDDEQVANMEAAKMGQQFQG